MENRNVKEILSEIKDIACIDFEVASSCFYVLINDDKPFVGISVRFAEIIASSWTNIKAGAKIVENNGRTITIRGFVEDTQKNSIFTVDIQRKIVDKKGFPLSGEIITQITNATSSIAFRNAIFKAVPAALFSGVVKDIKSFIVEELNNSDKLNDILAYFFRQKVTKNQLQEKLRIDDLENLSSEQIFHLIGLRNALEEGDTTIQETFGSVVTNHRQSKWASLMSSDVSIETPKEEIIKDVTPEEDLKLKMEKLNPRIISEGKKQELSLQKEEEEKEEKSTLEAIKDESLTPRRTFLQGTKDMSVEKIQKKGRGRPKKNVVITLEEEPKEEIVEKPKRGRGRPPKKK